MKSVTFITVNLESRSVCSTPRIFKKGQWMNGKKVVRKSLLAIAEKCNT